MVGYPRVLTERPRFRSVTDRPRLSSRSAVGRATVIVGPAGAGKSVLAAELADRIGGRLAWCRFAPGWDRAADLAGMMAASLGSALRSDGEDLLEAAGLVLDLLESEPTTLVVDDLHECEGTGAERLLAEVSSFLPDDAAIIVTTRVRPIEFIGLAGADITVVDPDELAFDAEEAARLFANHGMPDDAVDNALAATDGWAAALVATADAGGDLSTGSSSVIATALSASRLGSLRATAEALAALPYLSERTATILGVGGREKLQTLATFTSLVSCSGDQWKFHQSASDVVLGEMEDSGVAAIRAAAAPIIADEGDTVTAVELFIEGGDHDAAADLLAARASEIGPARATRWLYRLPAETRRRLPPVLTAGRATVNVNLAIESTRRQVAECTDERTRRELLLGLGSLQLAGGDLGDAAESFEAALRLASDDHHFGAAASSQLGLVRWLAGDTAGAAAAISGLDDDPWSQWLEAMMALASGDFDAARSHAEGAIALADGTDVTDAPGRSVLAALSLLADGPTAAAADALGAYEVALAIGGRDLAAAGPVHAWVLIRAGDLSAASAVADQIERVIGRHDFLSRFQCALIRRALALRGDSDDPAGRQRAERRVVDLRSHGYAVLETLAVALAGDDASESASGGLTVRFCGAFEIGVDGDAVDRGAWRSKKAMEVCALVCQAGPAGLRREQVIESIWEGREPEKGRTLLRTALSEIRRVLEPHRVAGQPSRFVTTAGDRIAVDGLTDLRQATDFRAAGRAAEAYELLAPGLAPELPDSEWVDELRGTVERMTVESASRVVGTNADKELMAMAFESLIAVEPWKREHFDGLAALHRSTGDELSAADVERRWFSDD